MSPQFLTDQWSQGHTLRCIHTSSYGPRKHPPTSANPSLPYSASAGSWAEVVFKTSPRNACSGCDENVMSSRIKAVATPRRRHAGSTRSRRTSPSCAEWSQPRAEARQLRSPVSASAVSVSPTRRSPTQPMIRCSALARTLATQNARYADSSMCRSSAGAGDQRSYVLRATRARSCIAETSAASSGRYGCVTRS